MNNKTETPNKYLQCNKCESFKRNLKYLEPSYVCKFTRFYIHSYEHCEVTCKGYKERKGLMTKIKTQLRTWWKYFKYIVEHKKNVFIECWREGLYVHAFTHDLSKLRPDEFFAYAEKHVNGNNTTPEAEAAFNKAWELHYCRNKHHWKHWSEKLKRAFPSPSYLRMFFQLDMPEKYIRQMVCDWRGMGRKFNDTAKEFYEKNKSNMILSACTVDRLQKYL